MYIRLRLEVGGERLAVDEAVASDHTSVGALSEDIEERSLSSARLTHERGESSGSDVARDIGKQHAVLLPGDRHNVGNVLPGEDVCHAGSGNLFGRRGSRGCKFLRKFLVHSSAFFIFTSSLDGARLRATLEQSDGGVNRCGRIELGEHEEGSGESDAEGKTDPKILPRRYE